jgi:hypothetical protein
MLLNVKIDGGSSFCAWNFEKKDTLLGLGATHMSSDGQTRI